MEQRTKDRLVSGLGFLFILTAAEIVSMCGRNLHVKPQPEMFDTKKSKIEVPIAK